MLLSLAPRAGAEQKLPQIERHRVGEVAIGADAREVYRAFPAERRRLIDLELEGSLAPALALTLPGATQPGGLVAELVCGPALVVYRIRVRDPAFRTERGIGVGSTVGELREAYAAGPVLEGEGAMVVRVEELGASFVLDPEEVALLRLWGIETPEEIPEHVEIVSVLLTR